jgi:hypothetical protein
MNLKGFYLTDFAPLPGKKKFNRVLLKNLFVILFVAVLIHPNPVSATSDSLPELNQKIMTFVDSKMKKKVGRGECWDLAAFALNEAGANWNGKLKFGRLLDPKTETIIPGDIIQFEGVKIKFEKEGMKYKQTFAHHTGIIYAVNSQLQFVIANQNTSQHGKKVSLTTVNLGDVTSGRYFIYRPEK